ncbi:helix-turn-helix domain-containing protein [Cypionkella sinensis]|uniref:Helix-turn-helix domain-containing protein n=1 Tax=Cypionkella sinensis TaxID=1756043 RepID=A0ABV7IXF1_9RHOB
MDLTKMNRGDLDALIRKLHVISSATDVLALGGLEPSICLTGEASVITVEPILSFGPVAEVALFEFGIDFAAPEPLQVSEPVEAAAQKPGAVGPRLYRPHRGKPATLQDPQMKEEPAELDLVSGPVTNAERQQIEALHKQGMSNADIAKRLNRHGSIIGTCIYHLKRQAKAPATGKPAAKLINEEAARKEVVCLAGQAADTPRAESAQIQKPGGDQGGLQQLRPAENDPVQSGARDGQLAAIAPDEAAPAYTGETKRIWEHVKALGFPKGWDAELDLEAVEAFGRGMKLDRLALDLDVDAKLIRDRYAALTSCIRDERGHMSIDGQEKLVRIVRDRLKALRAGAKAA